MVNIGLTINSFFKSVEASNIDEFRRKKIKQNNRVILAASAFLSIEQFLYGWFLSKQNSLVQKIHFFTAVLMFSAFLVSLYIYTKKKYRFFKFNIFFETFIALTAIAVASSRVVFLQEDIFYLPSIYIAVIYGLAIFLNLNLKQSIFIYFSGALFLIFMLENYRPLLNYKRVYSDIIVNNLLAWIISLMHYQKSISEFNHIKIIEDNYLDLDRRSRKISRINEQLKSKSITDELTNLNNRREMENNLDYLFIESKKRQDKYFSIIMCDLDDFSEINNNYGHQVGDKVLIEVSNIFKKNIRGSDICGRWGGEEFLILCPEANIKEAYKLAERLRIALEENNFKEVDKVTGSFGVASFSNNESRDGLLNKADKRLYKAKERGKNQSVMR